MLKKCGEWDPARDAKLSGSSDLLTQKHPREKVLVFTQFADTVDYLAEQVRAQKIGPIAAVTGDSENPTALVWRFSPESNEKRSQVQPDQNSVS